MDRGRWVDFQTAVANALLDVGCDLIQYPALGESQVGRWGDAVEGASAFVALHIGDPSPWLRPTLAEIKHVFRQDAIGYILVAGSNHLITEF